MTHPRRVLPDTVVEVTQRTLARTFRFLPRAEISNLFLYVLGVASERYNVRLHGFSLMATHYHLLVHDVDGRLPIFVQYVNSLVARAINAMQGESDKVWSGSGYVAVCPQSADDVMARMVYGLANPSAAGLVNRVEDFPGLVITPNRIGVVNKVQRPEFFSRKGTQMPECVDVRFDVPDGWDHIGLEQYREELASRLREREARHRAQRKADGVAVVGAKRLGQVAAGRRSSSWEAWFTLKPVIAAKLKSQRVAAIRVLRAFRDAYRAAWEAWRAGDRDRAFPSGTWWMARYAGVTIG